MVDIFISISKLFVSLFNIITLTWKSTCGLLNLNRVILKLILYLEIYSLLLVIVTYTQKLIYLKKHFLLGLFKIISHSKMRATTQSLQFCKKGFYVT